MQVVADGEQQHAADRDPPRDASAAPSDRYLEHSTPTTVPAARMPNVSSASWTSPKTSLDAPAIICPAASSTVPVVSTPPGRNVASGAISSRIGSPTSTYGRDQEHRERARERREDREHQLQRPGPHEFREADERAEHEGHERALPGRGQQERQARDEERVPEGAHEPAVPRAHRADLVQAPDALDAVRRPRRLPARAASTARRSGRTGTTRQRRTERDAALLRRSRSAR